MIFYHSVPQLQTKAARKEATSKTVASPTTSEMLVTLKTFAAPLPQDRLILLKGVGTVGAGEVGEEVEVLHKISHGSRLPEAIRGEEGVTIMVVVMAAHQEGEASIVPTSGRGGVGQIGTAPPTTAVLYRQLLKEAILTPLAPPHLQAVFEGEAAVEVAAEAWTGVKAGSTRQCLRTPGLAWSIHLHPHSSVTMCSQ